ncbi:MAG: DinB family protein [Balneola sp.]
METDVKSRDQIELEIHEAFDAVINFIRQQDDSLFDRPKAEGKWSTGQQLDHLIKSVKPLTTGMGLPKFLLKIRFGTRNRPERTFEELVAKYHKKLKEGGQASPAFIPPKISIKQKDQLLAIYEKEKINLVKVLQKWSEKQLSTNIAPHPLLGKCTVRELLYFTIYHNFHHLKSIEDIP